MLCKGSEAGAGALAQLARTEALVRDDEREQNRRIHGHSLRMEGQVGCQEHIAVINAGGESVDEIAADGLLEASGREHLTEPS